MSDPNSVTVFPAPSPVNTPDTLLSIPDCKRILHNLYYESQSLWQLKTVLESFEVHEKRYNAQKEDLKEYDILQADVKKLQTLRATLQKDVNTLTQEHTQLLKAINDVKTSFTALIGKAT